MYNGFHKILSNTTVFNIDYNNNKKTTELQINILQWFSVMMLKILIYFFVFK